MYRKYVQELSASSASPDPDFPDNHLIVGEAHLKAARAGAAHLDHQPAEASTPAMAASPSSAGLSDTRTAHTTASNLPPTPPQDDDHSDHDSRSGNSSRRSSSSSSSSVSSSSNGSVSSVPLSVRSDGALASVGRAAGSDVLSAGNDVHSSGGVCRGRRRLRNARRHSELLRLQNILSCSNTPEFRRRPASLALPRPASHDSPPRLLEDDAFSSFSQDEVIVVRPVAEASRARSPLYPAPRGDLLHPNHRGGSAPRRGLIRVLSAPGEACGKEFEAQRLEGEASSSSRLSNSSWGRDGDPWITRAPTPRPPSPSQASRRHSAGPSLYSMLCCRAFSSGR
ncbi:uncharacterized protein LOC126986189 [Eriocheir sinensis]|uniref:uncharacterized protein LOC126986189 n=1 Tax=Eriocheir sinensis TaxID=95602 RepID=UPI0021C97622|nr:uncharacterized protein LOC126986189 [Eriocheir sinensis]